MTDQNESPRKYMIHIRLGGTSPLISRIAESMPRLKEEIMLLSHGNYTVAWTSEDGGSIAFFVVTKLNSAQLLARIESPDKDSLSSGTKQTYRGEPLAGEDQIAVVELGEDYATRRLEQPIAWLRNR